MIVRSPALKTGSRGRSVMPEDDMPRSAPVSRPIAATPERRIRVLHVISTLLRGGTEMAMLHLIRNLDPERYAFRVAYLRGEPALGADLEAAIGVPAEAIHLRAKIDPAALVRLRAYVRRERIDLVHTHMDLADYYGAAAARLGGARGVVSTKHNADEFRTRRTWKRYPFLLAERLAYESADRVVVVSEGLADFLVNKTYLPRRKMVVVGNGVDPDIASTAPSRAEARRRLGLPAWEPLIGCVGRLEPQKGHRYLLEALPEVISEHPGAGLLLIGEGPLQKDLEDEACRLGLRGRVAFLGYRREIPELLAALDLFVLPSLWEGLSKALLEAMAMSCPVVAASAVGTAEVLRDQREGILVPPADVRALGAAMRTALGDPALAVRLGRAARQRVVESFSMRAVAAQYDRIYRQILGGLG